MIFFTRFKNLALLFIKPEYLLIIGLTYVISQLKAKKLGVLRLLFAGIE
jgi:hypothetical protein